MGMLRLRFGRRVSNRCNEYVRQRLNALTQLVHSAHANVHATHMRTKAPCFDGAPRSICELTDIRQSQGMVRKMMHRSRNCMHERARILWQENAEQRQSIKLEVVHGRAFTWLLLVCQAAPSPKVSPKVSARKVAAAPKAADQKDKPAPRPATAAREDNLTCHCQPACQRKQLA